MTYVNSKLLKAADEGSAFIKLLVNGSTEGKYIRCSSKIDKKYGKLKWDFVFEVEGKEKVLSTSATKCLRKMAYIQPGTLVLITKLGEGQQTDYSFEPVSSKSKKKHKKETEEKVEESEDDDENPF